MKSMPARRPLAVALLWLAALGGLDVARPALPQMQVSAVDYEHLADLIANRSLKPPPGDRVVRFPDATRHPGLATTLRQAINAARGGIEEPAARECGAR